jgi:PAS domain S-box-containing protein
MVAVSSARGDLEYVNQRVLDFFGQPFAGLRDDLWTDFVHPDDVDRVCSEASRARDAGQPLDLVYRVRRADGAYRWIHRHAMPLRDGRDAIIRWYGWSFDIHDHQESEHRLLDTQRKLARAGEIAAVAELSASIAHEINQPLAAVVANAYACQRWLASDPPNIDRARLAADRIVHDGQAAADVVSRIRELFKQAPLRKVALDLNDVVTEVFRMLADEVQGRGVAIEMDLDADLPPVLADRVQIQQVLVNLARNGIEAMHGVVGRPKVLVIRSERHGTDSVRIDVMDHGRGIADAERLFEAFYTTKATEMGMGLAISRSIIEAHGGRLSAQTNDVSNDAEGATFSFVLPIGGEAAE